VRANNQQLVQRYALKNTQREKADECRVSFQPGSQGVDVLMLFIYLGCKLASQQLDEAS